ncbi:Sodium/glucose cotransporter 5, partial [Globisporangium splendens]
MLRKKSHSTCLRTRFSTQWHLTKHNDVAENTEKTGEEGSRSSLFSSPGKVTPTVLLSHAWMRMKWAAKLKWTVDPPTGPNGSAPPKHVHLQTPRVLTSQGIPPHTLHSECPSSRPETVHAAAVRSRSDDRYPPNAWRISGSPTNMGPALGLGAAAAAAAFMPIHATAGIGGVDLALCVLYLFSVLCVGFYFTLKERRDREKLRQLRLCATADQIRMAKSNGNTDSDVSDEQVLEEYYLGGRRIPWWALGIADVSSYIDISGTMINTALVYALGVKGMYIEIRGGLCLFLAFQLAYTGKLSRRCPVKTRGEWIKFRFGSRRDGILLRTTIAFTSMVNGILAVTYFAVGGEFSLFQLWSQNNSGKFFTEFISISPWLDLPPEFWAALSLMVVAILYTIASGFTTVVYTDVYQSLFIFASFVIVAVMGMTVTLPDHFSVFLPIKNQGHGHGEPMKMLEIEYSKSSWLSAIPPQSLGLPDEAAYSMYNSFGLIIGSYLLLQTMRSASGPGGSGLQSVLATKSEKEVRSQTFLAMALLALRWAFSGGVAVMAIQYTLEQHPTGFVMDPERVVPVVIANMLPVGIKGFVLASLLAAALTTFDTSINSSSAYWTVDIYHALINPQASESQLLRHARASTLFVMVSGLSLSLYVDTINRIWGFMSIAMAGGFVWPFFFSWYWSRFNAYSCLCGVLSGFIAAFSTFIFAPLLPEFTAFLIISCVSFVVSIGVCLMTRPAPDGVLRRFYRFARPPGAWYGVKHMCFTQDTIEDINKENRLDLACTGLIAATQLALYLFAVSFVAKAWTQSLVLLLVMCVLAPIVYLKWYKKLQDRPVGLQKSDLNAELLE